MAKQLKDILKAAHDTIKGAHKSTTEPLSTGKDPGVDYKPKAGDEADFIAKHSVEKWDEPYGNPNYADKVGYTLSKEKNHGNTEAKAKAANEETEVSKSKKAEDIKCNMSEAGTRCPMHEMADCSSARTIKELSTDLLHRAAHKAAKVAMTDVQGRSGPIFKKRAAQANKFRAKGMEQEKKEKAMKEAVAPGTFVEPSDAAKAKAKQVQQKDADKAIVDRAKMGIKSEEVVNEISTKLALSYAKGASKSMDTAAAKGSAGHETFMKRSAGHKLALDKTNPEHKRLKAKVGTTDANAKDAAYKKAMKEDLAVPLLGGDQNDDESAEMAKAELKAIANQAMTLVMQIPDTMIIEPWVQSKIAQAKVMISGVHDYMVYGDHDKQKEAEGTMDTPMTFPNMSVDVNTGQNV